jgi:hypothetical protein
MSEKRKPASDKLGSLDPLTWLFRAREETPKPEPQAASRLDSLQESFDAALQGLEQKPEESRRAAPSTGPVAAPLAGLGLLERALRVLDPAAGLVGIGWLPPPGRAPGRGGSPA